jgi:hypothetical protein
MANMFRPTEALSVIITVKVLVVFDFHARQRSALTTPANVPEVTEWSETSIAAGSQGLTLLPGRVRHSPRASRWRAFFQQTVDQIPQIALVL